MRHEEEGSMPTTSAAPAARDPLDDPVLELIMAALAERPQQDRNELLAFLDFFRDLPSEERALFAKSVKPDLTDDQIARIAGRSRRQLYRYERYRGVKARIADLGAAKRRKRHKPDDDAA
jgi:hypothetical protein